MNRVKIAVVLGVVLLGGIGIIVFADEPQSNVDAHVQATVVDAPPEDATIVSISAERFDGTPSLRNAVQDAVANKNGTSSDAVNSKSELQRLEQALNKEIRYTTTNGTAHYYVKTNGTVLKVQVWQLA